MPRNVTTLSQGKYLNSFLLSVLIETEFTVDNVKVFQKGTWDVRKVSVQCRNRNERVMAISKEPLVRR